MKRARAGSERPIAWRKSGCSEGSSSEISASTGAQSEIASAPRSPAAASTSAGGGLAAASSGAFTTTSSGRRERNPKWAISFSSASLQRIVRSGLPASSCPCSRSNSWNSALVLPCSLRSRSSRFSTMPRSCSRSSASKSLSSRDGPGKAPSSAGNPRTTRQKASTSASARSDSGGSPEPLEGAPGTSTKSISQLVLRGLKMAASASTLGSGTLIAPRFTSPRAAAPPLCRPVSALNSVVLPDCAYPTRPAFMAPPRGGPPAAERRYHARRLPSRPRLPAGHLRDSAGHIRAPEAFFRLRIPRRYDRTVQLTLGPRAREIAIDAAVAALIVGLFLGLLVASDRVATGSNPDQWFHFAISRMSQRGLVRTLPQAEDLGWAVGFPEKEFLFHRLTALAYGIGGESAVVLACRAVSVASRVLLYWLARQAAGRVVVAASVAGLVVANPYLLFRLGMVRPHVLAIFLLLAIVAALLCRSRFLGFAAGASFALAYHAVYLPAVLALAFGIVALHRRAAARELDDGAFAASALVLAGLACGVVANRYFPANVAMGLEHLGFAFSASASLPGVHVGAEVLPMAPSNYLRFFGVALLAAIASVAWLRRDAAGGEQPWNRAVLTVAALFLVGAGLRSVRATEYGLPLLALAVAAAPGDARRSA